MNLFITLTNNTIQGFLIFSPNFVDFFWYIFFSAKNSQNSRWRNDESVVRRMSVAVTGSFFSLFFFVAETVVDVDEMWRNVLKRGGARLIKKEQKIKKSLSSQ